MRIRSLSLFAIALCVALLAGLGAAAVAGAAPRPQKVFGADVYEPDDSLTEAKVLPAISTHTFDSNTDQDWCKITAEDTGTPFVIEALPVDGMKIDTRLTVYDLEATQVVEVAGNEDREWGPPTYASSLLFRAPHPGTFYIACTISDSWDGPGEYTLFVNQGIARRLGGATRFDTAALVSRTVWPDAGLPSYAGGDPYNDPAGPDTVVLANGWNFADGLAGVPFACGNDTTLLLSDPTTLTPAARDEISRLLRNAYWGHHDTTVYVLGGPNVMSENVLEAIRGITEVGDVQRIYGKDRAGTAAAIAGAAGHGILSTPIRPAYAGRTAFICNGFADADALAAGPVAGWVGGSVLFVNTTSIPASTTAALADFDRVVIVGSTTVVSSGVEAQLDSIMGTSTVVERVSGTDRYKTAKALATWGIDHGMTADGVVLASGWAWPDGLSAGPLAYQLAGPLLLTSPTALSPEVSSFLDANGSRTKVSYVVGSTSVVSTSTATSLAGIAGPMVLSR